MQKKAVSLLLSASLFLSYLVWFLVVNVWPDLVDNAPEQVDQASVAQLTGRLEYMTFASERIKLRRDIITALKRELNQSPFDAALLQQFFHYSAFSGDVGDARFAFLPAYRLTTSAVTSKLYFADLCAGQRIKAQLPNIDRRLCQDFRFLIPKTMSPNHLARRLGVSYERVDDLLIKQPVAQ